MTTKGDYVTQAECNERHGTSKARLAGISAVLLVLLAVPCVATAVAWGARVKAQTVETRVQAQQELLQTIHDDVREIRATQIQLLRNGKD